MRVLSLLPLIAALASGFAQSNPSAALPVWQMQDSGTTAGLRGIDSVDGTIAWASGTGGTVLKTLDGGAHWTQCAIPYAAKDGATLDFRGVQAWDADTAIVMASGKGKLSRLYKTKDGCKTWKLVFKNPDKDGFWDALYFQSFGHSKGHGDIGWLLGDPVKGMFTLFYTEDFGNNWYRQHNKGLRVKQNSPGVFAASNSSLFAFAMNIMFGTSGSFVFSGRQTEICFDCSMEESGINGNKYEWNKQLVFTEQSKDSAGIFSIDGRANLPITLPITFGKFTNFEKFVEVGGDYTKPNESTGTAAWSKDSGWTWTASTTPPHGFRSVVQYSEALKLWITAGTNGSDISRDDGKTWQPLDNGNWNALSLPFVVGPNGRIARINPAALPAVR